MSKMMNMDMEQDDEPEEPEPGAEPTFNPCFCTDLDLRRSTIVVAVFSLFFHTALMVAAFAIFIYYPGYHFRGNGNGLNSPFRIATLVVGIVNACLIPVASLIFIGAVKRNRKLCICWLWIIIPSTLSDVAGLIVEQTIGIVIVEIIVFLIRAFTVWVVWSFVTELGQEEEARKVAELRRDVELSLSRIGSNNPSGDGRGSEPILAEEGELVD